MSNEITTTKQDGDGKGNGNDQLTEKQLEKEKVKHKKTRRGQRISNNLKKFTVRYQNIRGLKSKFDSLLEKREEFEPTVVCITEAHVLEDEPVGAICSRRE